MNSYVFRPKPRSTNSRVYTSEEIALLAKPSAGTEADMWHLRLGHLNFQDMCKLKSRAVNISFEGKPCFCETCVLSKMRAVPFQNQGHKGGAPKQIICFDVSGPFPPTASRRIQILF